MIRAKGMDKVEDMPAVTTEGWEGDVVPREKAEAKQTELVEMTMSIMRCVQGHSFFYLGDTDYSTGRRTMFMSRD